MDPLHIVLLALLQGLCELLPVSSSAHVITAEKLLGLDPTTPEMTLLLVTLHTGTMGSVLVYFWKGWKRSYLSSRTALFGFARPVILATACTGTLGLALLLLLEKVVLKAEVETLFGRTDMIALALFTVGLLILFAASRAKVGRGAIGTQEAVWIGLVQGLCLPFRGFSRSGATISTGLLLGVERAKAEDFSFALVLVLTPAVLVRELHRLLESHSLSGLPPEALGRVLLDCGLGMVLSFGAGLLALKWLSDWLMKGRWGFFGLYCLAASAVLYSLHRGLGW